MSRPSAGARRTTRSEYIETDTGNKISRRAHIEGKQNIMLGGKSVLMAGVTLRGDLHRITTTTEDINHDGSGGAVSKSSPVTAISVGKYTVVSTNCTLHPPMRLSHGMMNYYPMRIGDNVFIGPNTHVSAVAISSHVHIGAECVLGPFSMLKESCRVLPGTVVPAHMVVPPGCVVAGRPARIVGELGDGYGQGGFADGEEWVEGGDLRALVRSIK